MASGVRTETWACDDDGEPCSGDKESESENVYINVKQHNEEDNVEMIWIDQIKNKNQKKNIILRWYR